MTGDRERCPTCGDDHLWRLNPSCYQRYLEADKAASDDVIEALAARIAELEAQLRVVITTEKHATDQVATLRAALDRAERDIEHLHDAATIYQAEKLNAERERDGWKAAASARIRVALAADPEGGPTDEQS